MRLGTGGLSFPRWLVNTAPSRVLAVVALLAVQSLGSGLGILLLVPLLSLVGIGSDSTASGLVLLRGGLQWLGLEGSLLAVLAVYVGVNAVTAGSRAMATVQAGRLREETVLAIRRQVYRAAMTARWAGAKHPSASQFTHVLTAEAGRVGLSTDLLVRFASATVVLVAYVAIALMISWWCAALALGGGLVMALVLRGGRRRSAAAGRAVSEAVSALYAAAAGHLAGRKTIRVHGLERQSSQQFAALAADVGEQNVALRRVEAWSRAGFNVLAVLALAVFVYVFVRTAPDATSVLIVSLVLAASTLIQLDLLHDGLVRYLAQVPAYARTTALLEDLASADRHFAAGEVPAALPLETEVRLEGVSFAYETRESAAVCEVDLRIPAHQTTALVGRSGSGKTTIADLVVGLLEPTSGRVEIDGEELDPVRQRQWMVALGYVGQDVPLLPGTVRDNLLWGNPEANASQLWGALEQADAHQFVAELELGLDTNLGDDGARLSGGEAQRLALARALVRQPSLLILDEATSQLDAHSERRIQRTFDALRGSTTILMISHRMASVRRADQICVVMDGRIVERGTFAELIAREGGEFRSLCAAQNIVASEAELGTDVLPFASGAVRGSPPQGLERPCGADQKGSGTNS